MKTEDNLGPDLQGFQKENPFLVPDGYFDRFPLKMSERIAEQKKQSRFHFHSLFKPSFGPHVIIFQANDIASPIMKFATPKP
jgi:hypothetical protein